MEVSFTGYELQFMDDNLTLFLGDDAFDVMVNTPSTPMIKIPANSDLIMKIGEALVEIYDNYIDEVTINLDYHELWVLRELANSNFRIQGNSTAGLDLKLKVYRALQQFEMNEAKETADSLIAEVGLTTITEDRDNES